MEDPAKHYTGGEVKKTRQSSSMGLIIRQKEPANWRLPDHESHQLGGTLPCPMSMRQGKIRLGAGATFERSKLRRTPRGRPEAISYQLDPE